MLVNKTKLSIERKVKTFLETSSKPILVEDNAILWLLKRSVVVELGDSQDEFEILPKENGYISPMWVKKVRAGKIKFVIFRNLDLISKEDQEKVLQIIHHKSVSGVNLPQGLRIVLTFKKGSESKINERLLEYVTFIQE